MSVTPLGTLLRRRYTILRARMMPHTTYLPTARMLAPGSEIVFGKDDHFWAKMGRIVPHRLSYFEDDFIAVIGWIVRNGEGVWAYRGAQHRNMVYGFDPYFRHVFYFSEPNDAFAFRMRFDCRTGDVSKDGSVWHY